MTGVLWVGAADSTAAQSLRDEDARFRAQAVAETLAIDDHLVVDEDVYVLAQPAKLVAHVEGEAGRIRIERAHQLGHAGRRQIERRLRQLRKVFLQVPSDLYLRHGGSVQPRAPSV